jgi:hypothetical protein
LYRRIIWQVLACNPMYRRVKVRAIVLTHCKRIPVHAGPRSSKREIVSIRNGGVLPNCGGRLITGVSGPSGAVKSTTLIVPLRNSSAIAEARSFISPHHI